MKTTKTRVGQMVDIVISVISDADSRPQIRDLEDLKEYSVSSFKEYYEYLENVMNGKIDYDISQFRNISCDFIELCVKDKIDVSVDDIERLSLLVK
jgi:hypothetical protein